MALRGLEMGFRRGYAEASRILWGEALGTDASEKLKTERSQYQVVDLFCENLRAYLDGPPLADVID